MTDEYWPLFQLDEAIILPDGSYPFFLESIVQATREKGLFSPHVGERMVQDVSCSVLIIAK